MNRDMQCVTDASLTPIYQIDSNIEIEIKTRVGKGNIYWTKGVTMMILHESEKWSATHSAPPFNNSGTKRLNNNFWITEGKHCSPPLSSGENS